MFQVLAFQELAAEESAAARTCDMSYPSAAYLA